MDGTARLRVFISYRREDTAGYARRLHDSIPSRLASVEVLMDVGAIQPGVDSTTAIADALAGCHVMLALIGPRWTTTATSSGRRRLDEPGDHVVTEIATALEQDIRVIPVLIDGALMPGVTDLPERIRPLTRRRPVRLGAVSWPADLEEAVSAPHDDAGAHAGVTPHESAGSTARRFEHRDIQGIVAAMLAFILIHFVASLAGGDSGNERPGIDTPRIERPSPVRGVLVAPVSGPDGTTVEISGDPCPAAPEGTRPDDVYFGLHDPRAVAGTDNPATGGVPLIPGEPWKGELRVPDGITVGEYLVFARCFASEGTGRLAFYDYANSTFEVSEI